MIQIQSYVKQIQGCGATIGEMYFQQIQRYIPGLVPVMSSISSENLKTFIVSHSLNIFMCIFSIYTCVHMKIVISTSNMTPLTFAIHRSRRLLCTGTVRSPEGGCSRWKLLSSLWLYSCWINDHDYDHDYIHDGINDHDDHCGKPMKLLLAWSCRRWWKHSCPHCGRISKRSGRQWYRLLLQIIIIIIIIIIDADYCWNKRNKKK